MQELDFRAPLIARIFASSFCGGFVIFVAASLALAFARHQDVSGAPIAIGMAVFAGALGYRLASLSCHARGTEMIIHNYWRTRRVEVCQIAGLDIGRTSAGNLWTVRILTGGGAIPIDVLGITRGTLARSRVRAMGKLEKRRRELADWLDQNAAITGAERGSIQ